MIPPRKIIGIVPIRVDIISFSCKKKSIKFFENRLLKLKKSFLKYQISAKMLPNWSIADREEPGSSIPKTRDMIFRWAVLLTGKNSVKPWIKP